MSELKETKKMKIIALYDYTTKLKLLYSLLQERQSEQDNKFENIFVWPLLQKINIVVKLPDFGFGQD